MNKKVATIILNRNLPKVTNTLYNNLKNHNKKISDFYILEAGSVRKKLSKNYTWHANWKSAKKNGLRFARGMNYALSNLYKEKKFDNYKAFFLITNDTTFENYNIIEKLYNVLSSKKKIAILSPCSKNWGEYRLLKRNKTKFFWYIHNNALMIKKEFIKEVLNLSSPGYLNFLFDGNNFRGYGLESELIAKAYSNNWSAAITSKVLSEENESYLINNFEEIKTESYDNNLKLYLKEGKKWMKNKYGFSNKWAFQLYVKNFYDKFFENNPEYKKYRL
tara:strand:+ start:1848 stop:2675 length:828 start_codon:yes stop_codon:yes gene_type:complete